MFKLTFCEAMSVRLVCSAPEPNARMVEPLFSVSLRFSGKGTRLFSVSCGMALSQLTRNARRRQANTPDFSAMAMPTPVSKIASLSA